jgi:hypothetical protein
MVVATQVARTIKVVYIRSHVEPPRSYPLGDLLDVEGFDSSVETSTASTDGMRRIRTTEPLDGFSVTLRNICVASTLLLQQNHQASVPH